MGYIFHNKMKSEVAGLSYKNLGIDFGNNNANALFERFSLKVKLAKKV